MPEKVAALTISFNDIDYDARTYSDRYWAKIEQEAPEDDTASLNDAAAILDAAFGIDPCEEAGFTPSEDGEPELTETEYWDVLANFFRGTYNPCIVANTEDGTYPLYVRIYLSHRTDCDSNDPIPYTYHIDKGEVVNTQYRVAEYITQEIAINNSEVHYLEYPAKHYCEEDRVNSAQFTARWLSGGTSFEKRGNILYFSEETSGILEVSYYTEYDRLTINTPLDSDGQPEDLNILLFYKQLVYDEKIYGPDIEYNQSQMCGSGSGSNILVNPDCRKTQFIYDKCKCSQKTIFVENRDLIGPCKDLWEHPFMVFRDYVDCGEVTGDINTRAFYEQECCQQGWPPLNLYNENFTLPNCWREWSRLRPTGTPDPADFPEDTRFIAIGPKDGDCGDWLKEQVLNSQDCCGPGLPTFEWTQTVDFIGWGDTAIFCVSGGAPPYTWETEGAGLVVEAQWSTADGGCARIKANNCMCLPLYVQVTDACEQVLRHDVKSDEGFWEEIPNEENPLYIPGSLYTATNGAQIDDSSNRTFVYETEEYKLTQVMSLKVDYTGCNYTSCTNPVPLAEINWDYRCWGRNPGSWGDTASLFDPFGNGSASDWPDDLPSSGHWPYKWNDLQGVTYWSGGNWDSTAGRCGLGGVPNPVWAGVYGYDIGTAVSHKWVCPDGVDELEYDDANSADVIGNDDSVLIFWTGGRPPFTVEIIEGDGVYVNSDKNQIKREGVDDQFIRLYSTNSCGVITVRIEDKCEEKVEGLLRSTEGQWFRHAILYLGTSQYSLKYGCRDAGYGSPDAATGVLLWEISGRYGRAPNSTMSYSSKTWHLGADIICPEDVSYQEDPEPISGMRAYETEGVYQEVNGEYQIWFWYPSNVTNYSLNYFEWMC